MHQYYAETSTYTRVLSLLLVCRLVVVGSLVGVSPCSDFFAIEMTGTHKEGSCSRERHSPAVQLIILDLCQCLHHSYVSDLATVPNRVMYGCLDNLRDIAGKSDRG